jgi:hypothetical protein
MNPALLLERMNNIQIEVTSQISSPSNADPVLIQGLGTADHYYQNCKKYW